jgi:RNA polymerase sigma-B factor
VHVSGTDIAPLRARRDRELFARMKHADDMQARDELVERFMGLAHRVAVRYGRRSEPFDDVLQVAALGLIKAIDRYDPDRGTAFSSFAVPTMLGEIKRHFRDCSWSVRPPRDLQELALRVNQVAKEMTATRGQAPTVGELADAMSRPDEEILEALDASRARTATSLNMRCGDESDGTTLGDTLGGDEDGFARAEDRATLAVLLAHLSDSQREVLRLRFEQDLTQSEIGELVGLSQMQISRILRGSIAQLGLHADRPLAAP